MEMFSKDKDNSWMINVIIGLILLIVGILIAIFKGDSLKIILIVMGVCLLIPGISGLVISIKNKSDEYVIPAVIYTVVGILLIIIPNFFADLAIIMLGIGLIIIGGAAVFMAVTHRSENSKVATIVMIILGVLLAILGALVMINFGDAKNIVMLIVGILTAVAGAIYIIAGLNQKFLWKEF